MKLNNNFKHDLEVGQLAEKNLADIFSNSTIEVKMDFMAYKTGNIYVEYESYKKPSGIATSEADFWCIYIMTEKGKRLQKNPKLKLEKEDVETIILLSLKNLKHLCKTKYFRKDVKGGDFDACRGLLIKAKDLV
jgi:hypothetical protein